MCHGLKKEKQNKTPQTKTNKQKVNTFIELQYYSRDVWEYMFFFPMEENLINVSFQEEKELL